jgi:hypothetical protein
MSNMATLAIKSHMGTCDLIKGLHQWQTTDVQDKICGLVRLPELRELHAREIGYPPSACIVSIFRIAGDQETPYANPAQTNAIKLYLASCPALGREQAESGSPVDATNPNADLQHYREPRRMAALNLSLKTYFQSFFSTTTRPAAASNAGRGSKLQKHGADYIPVPMYIEKLNAGLRDERPRVSLEQKHQRIHLTTLRLSRPVRSEAQRQRLVNSRIPSRGHRSCGAFSKI